MTKTSKKPDVASDIEIISIKHRTGEISKLIVKSYNQERDNFKGTDNRIIWLDDDKDI